uniref:SFRICE_022814 n=1 Tax=Spodoptera frugiperda TaxID=7108 RepID=A0A2H1V059_SPOFR
MTTLTYSPGAAHNVTGYRGSGSKQKKERDCPALGFSSMSWHDLFVMALQHRSTNCCFGSGCHVYVNLYVCKCIHGTGEYDSMGQIKKTSSHSTYHLQISTRLHEYIPDGYN